MPDNKMTIGVYVSGEDDLNRLAAAINDGSASINDQIKYVKLATQVYKSWGSENNALKAGLASSIATVKNLTEEGMKPLLSYTGQIRDSYFSNGEALRVQDAGERGLTDTIRSARQERRMYMFAVREGEAALTSIVGQQKGLTSAMTEGAGAFFGIQFAMQAMGKAVADFAMPAGVLVATWTVLNSLMKAGKELDDAFVKSIEANTKAATDLGLITKQQTVEMLKQQLIVKEREKVEPDFWKSMLGIGAMWEDFLTRQIDKQTQSYEIELKLRKARQEAWDEKHAAFLKSLDEDDERDRLDHEYQLELANDRAEEAHRASYAIYWDQKWFDERKAHLQELYDLQVKYMNLGIATRSEMVETPTKIGVENKPLPLGINLTGRRQRVAGITDEDVTKPFTKMENLSNNLMLGMHDGFQRATNTLAQGFTKAIGIGRGLLGDMLSDIVDSIAKAGISTLLSYIPFIGPLLGGAMSKGATGHASGGYLNEKVVGIGMSTRSIHTFGEDGPEWFSPANRVGQQGRYGGSAVTINPSIHIVPIESNSGLAVRVTIGNRELSHRVIG